MRAAALRGLCVYKSSRQDEKQTKDNYDKGCTEEEEEEEKSVTCLVWEMAFMVPGRRGGGGGGWL